MAEIALGVVFLAVAVRIAFGRNDEPSGATTRWLDRLDRSGTLGASVLALILSSGNPKNLALMLAAAVAIAQEGRLALGAAGFVALAVSTVSLLLAAYVAFSSRAQSALARLRGAIARHERRIAMVVGFLVGAFFVADGVRGL